MFLRKYRYLIVAIFMGIFVAKMGISGAPVFFADVDKEIMNAVIMQIEVEHGHGKDSGNTGDLSKFTDLKVFGFNHQFASYEFFAGDGLLHNNFIEHYGRYVDPHHPSVPTPPPNLV